MVDGQAAARSSKELSSLGGTERDRAERAWKIAKDCSNNDWFKQYSNLVKGSASLVMNNGLISALAYYKSKSRSGATEAAAKQLAEDIAHFAFPGARSAEDALEKLVKLESSSDYMLRTREVLANLRWLRQLVDAVGD